MEATKTVKRKAFSWWTREPTKGGSLPKNGQQRRALSDRFFSWSQAQPNAVGNAAPSSQLITSGMAMRFLAGSFTYCA